MENITDQIKALASSLGISDIGFCPIDDYQNFNTAISIVVRLSDAVIDEITTAPTFSYFHHYRTVNTFIDQCQLKIGLKIGEMGYNYIPVAASQSIPAVSRYSGIYSHKKAAVLSGLGSVGMNGLFLHKTFGARVRLGTILTDISYQHPEEFVLCENPCNNCGLCVSACPAGALSGENFDLSAPEKDLLDREMCSKFMKKEYMSIGRGSVCGICMRVCPQYSKIKKQ